MKTGKIYSVRMKQNT